jgi:hypothetical protein
MKKIFLAMIFAGITAVSAQAQFNLGIRVGLDAVGVHGNSVPVYNEDSKIESKTGFQVGIIGEYSVGNHFAIQPGLVFANYGFLNKGSRENIDLELDWNINYLQMPVNAMLKFGGNVKFFLQAGPYLGYALNAKWKGTSKSEGKVIETDEQTLKFEKDGMKRPDFGVGLGLGLQIKALQLGLGYQYGLMNVYDSVGYEMKNDCLAFTISYLFGKIK